MDSHSVESVHLDLYDCLSSHVLSFSSGMYRLMSFFRDFVCNKLVGRRVPVLVMVVIRIVVMMIMMYHSVLLLLRTHDDVGSGVGRADVSTSPPQQGGKAS